jgi:hypothetical protein
MWYCIALHCIVLYCNVLYCIVLYCIVLYCIVLYCIVLQTITHQDAEAFYVQSVEKETEDVQSETDFPLCEGMYVSTLCSNSYLVAKMTEETSKSKVTYCILY